MWATNVQGWHICTLRKLFPTLYWGGGRSGHRAQLWDSLLQAKAPNAVVLVVGTHLDLIEAKFRVERIATLRAYVLALCRSPSGSRATGFPDITFKHLQ